MLTIAQIIAAVRLNNNLEVNKATAPYNVDTINDITDYIGDLGFTGGDTAKILVKITSPVGTPVYENTGFAAADYSAPDFEYGVTTQIVKTFPTVSGSNTVIGGSYTIELKIQIEQGGDTYNAAKTIIFQVDTTLLRDGVLGSNYSCNANPPSFTVQDKTPTGGSGTYVLESATRTITIIPPPLSGLSPGTGTGTSLTVTPLWTGTYSYKTEGLLTFGYGTDKILVNYTASAENKVVCDDILCKMYCVLTTLRQDYYDENNPAKKERILNRILLGQFEYFMAVRARLCGDTGAESDYISKFFSATGKSSDCNCCSDLGPAPVIPSCGCVNGEDGESPELRINGTILQWKYPSDLAWNSLIDFASIVGKSFLQGSGAPDNGLGVDGDTYLDVATDNIYLKSSGTWSVTGNIKGDTGSPGYLIFTNTYPGTTTSGNLGYETLGSHTVAAGTMANEEDEIGIDAEFISLATENSSNQLLRIRFAGTTVFSVQPPSFYADNIYRAVVKCKVIRVSSDTVRIKTTVNYYVKGIGSFVEQWFSEVSYPDATVGSLNFAGTLAILAEAWSVTTADIVLDYFKVYYEKKV